MSGLLDMMNTFIEKKAEPGMSRKRRPGPLSKNQNSSPYRTGWNPKDRHLKHPILRFRGFRVMANSTAVMTGLAVGWKKVFGGAMNSGVSMSDGRECLEVERWRLLSVRVLLCFLRPLDKVTIRRKGWFYGGLFGWRKWCFELGRHLAWWTNSAEKRISRAGELLLYLGREEGRILEWM